MEIEIWWSDGRYDKALLVTYKKFQKNKSNKIINNNKPHMIFGLIVLLIYERMRANYDSPQYICRN